MDNFKCSLICLQYMSKEGLENLGALCVNIQHISEVLNVDGACKLVMTNGREYFVAQSISEVLEEIRARNMNER